MLIDQLAKDMEQDDDAHEELVASLHLKTVAKERENRKKLQRL